MSRFLLLSALTIAIPAATPVPALAQEWVMACAEGTRPCTIDGTRIVQFGANGAFYFGVATNRLLCSIETFGDPAPGIPKACWYKQSAFEQSLGALVAEKDEQVRQLTGHADALEREIRDLQADLNSVTGQLAQLQEQMRPERPERRPPPPQDRPRNKKN